MFSPLLQKNQDYLKDKIFVGVVEENKDTKRKGRIKVRVQGVFNDIELEHIPWASPFRNLDGKSFCVPAIGKIVNVIFPQGNLYDPQYIYSENYNINLQDKLEELTDDEYTNFVALLFDHRTQVYSDDNALNLDYYNNSIRLKKDSIDIKLKNNQQLLNLGHSFCDQDAVLGTNFFKWMDSFMDTLLIPSTLTGNFGAPILRPQLDQKIQEYKILRETFVSNNVKIVDNDKIEQDDYDKNRLNTPVKDDSTEINGVKILDNVQISPEQKSDDISNPIIEETKDTLPEKVMEERKKDLIETKENESEPEIIRPNYEIDHLDDLDQEIVQIREYTFENNINKTLNEDPYAGFWSGRKGREAQKEPETTTTTPGYGSYYSENSNSETSGTLEVGSSNSITVTGAVAKDKIILTDDLKKVQNSFILTKQSLGNKYQDPRDMIFNTKNGKVTVKGDDVVKSMNEFIQDVLGPLATFLKTKYPDLYKNWYITSATRAYVPIGGSATSQHFRGQAIDSQIIGYSDWKKLNDANLRFLNAILEFYKTKPVGYDQLLFETRNTKSNWIHLSYRRNNNRLQALRFVNDKTYRSKMNNTGKYLVSVDSNSANLYI